MAHVEIVNGQHALVDPEAVAAMRAVARHNCKATYDANAERVLHFRNRAKELGRDPAAIVIVVISVDDAHGSPLADALMPDFDWQAIRDRGEVPFARGLAERRGIQGALAMFDAEAARKLQAFDGLAVVVVDHGVAEVF